MARILIAGCGDVGATLGQSLSAAGHTVWGLKRQPAGLPPGIRPVAADLTDPATLTALPPELDAVVYSAAASGFSAAAYQAAYVDGVRHLVAALRATGQPLQRFLFTSSTSVYAQHQGEWVDEDSPAEAESFSGRCIREGERLLAASAWPTTVIRFGGIYGPGRTRLIASVRSGTATCPVGPPLYTNRIHRDDCARVLEHVLLLPQPLPLYLAVDDDPAPLDAVLRWLARQLGVAESPLAPAPALKPGAEVRGAALRLRASKRCRNARLRASGFVFRYPNYQEGYAALLRAQAEGTAPPSAPGV